MKISDRVTKWFPKMVINFYLSYPYFKWNFRSNQGERANSIWQFQQLYISCVLYYAGRHLEKFKVRKPTLIQLKVSYILVSWLWFKMLKKKENMHTETDEFWLKKLLILKTIMTLLCLGAPIDLAKTWEVLMKIQLLV
jgi:hypothetical protein